MREGGKPNFAEGTNTGKAPEGLRKPEGVLGARLEALRTAHKEEDEEKELNEIPAKMKAEAAAKQAKIDAAEAQLHKDLENARKRVEDQPRSN